MIGPWPFFARRPAALDAVESWYDPSHPDFDDRLRAGMEAVKDGALGPVVLSAGRLGIDDESIACFVDGWWSIEAPPYGDIRAAFCEGFGGALEACGAHGLPPSIVLVAPPGSTEFAVAYVVGVHAVTVVVTIPAPPG